MRPNSIGEVSVRPARRVSRPADRPVDRGVPARPVPLLLVGRPTPFHRPTQNILPAADALIPSNIKKLQ